MSTLTESMASLREEPAPNWRYRLVYLAPDCTDAAVKKRVHGFETLGHEVICFSFRRNRYNIGEIPVWTNVELGESRERRIASRIIALLRALFLIYPHRRSWRRATVLYARNLDLALLALLGKVLTRSPAPMIYEVLDIHPRLAAAGPLSSILRWIERRVLKRCQLLVVSSTAFLSNYFGPIQGYEGNSFLLENKWPHSSFNDEARELEYQLDEQQPVWRIGWFGNLRCKRSLEILTQLADTLPDRVKIQICGCSSLLGNRVVENPVRNRQNMEYSGEYSAPEDLSSIYTGVHFNWCVDFSDGKNSSWLIPNRLYEGGYFGVPALAVSGHETGRIVLRDKLGFTLCAPYAESLKSLLLELTPRQYKGLRADIEARKSSEFVDNSDLARLLKTIQLPSESAGE